MNFKLYISDYGSDNFSNYLNRFLNQEQLVCLATKVNNLTLPRFYEKYLKDLENSYLKMNDKLCKDKNVATAI